MSSYHFQKIDTPTWDVIEKRFEENWNDTEILGLVKHIRNSPLSTRLFGSTSLNKLVVSIYSPMDYQKEALHVTYDTANRKWHFAYYAIPFQEAEFERYYDTAQGISKFDQFVSMIKW